MRIPYRNKLLLKKILRISLIVLAVLLLITAVVLVYLEPYFVYDRSGAHMCFDSPVQSTESPDPSGTPVLEKPDILYADDVREVTAIAESGGYYITATMLKNPEKVLQQLKSLEEPCAVIMELKNIYGSFYYSTDIGGAKEASTDITVVDEIIQYLREHHFYMIASIAAFSDYNFALANPSCGLPLSNGALWMDENGCFWLDPASETVLSYLIQITRELAGLGFQEIAFSDFRFPVSSNIHYESDKTGTQLIEDAAGQLTEFFTGSNITISFVTDNIEFPANVCQGRLYISGADGSKAERFVQNYSTSGTLKELVFLANSRDTRFDELALLRPLLAE